MRALTWRLQGCWHGRKQRSIIFTLSLGRGRKPCPFSSECHATRFCRELLFSFLHALLVCFTRFFTFEQTSDKNKLNEKWLTSSIEAFYVKKKTKKGEIFVEGIRCVFCTECLFGYGNVDICPKNMPAKIQSCAIFVAGVFVQRKVLRRSWRDALLPQSISLATGTLIRATCCFCGFYGMPVSSGGISAAHSPPAQLV